MSLGNSVIIIVICAICTFCERLFPFVMFRNKEVPTLVRYLGKVLPMAVMGTLVVYCLRSTDFSNVALFVPQSIAVLVTAVLHLWKRNTLLSVMSGTVCYMFMIQVIF